ncbi:hypothetical protein GCM10009828_005960 [Actinoplanes couchii]|uniref:Uncharacterized protein n=1 Tax=Actinoplanes couchii TaxID=403638 RepID=A0ABQ3XJZ4_9ACTN|nr:hypothetical protein Aco03nite_072270 [Actinoplanes couchii]
MCHHNGEEAEKQGREYRVVPAADGYEGRGTGQKCETTDGPDACLPAIPHNI